jgi:FtsZ-interacting cell division protein ZipA
MYKICYVRQLLLLIISGCAVNTIVEISKATKTKLSMSSAGNVILIVVTIVGLVIGIGVWIYTAALNKKNQWRDIQLKAETKENLNMIEVLKSQQLLDEQRNEVLKRQTELLQQRVGQLQQEVAAAQVEIESDNAQEEATVMQQQRVAKQELAAAEEKLAAIQNKKQPLQAIDLSQPLLPLSQQQSSQQQQLSQQQQSSQQPPYRTPAAAQKKTGRWFTENDRKTLFGNLGGAAIKALVK